MRHDPEGPGCDQLAYQGRQGAEELQRLFRTDQSGEGVVVRDGPLHQQTTDEAIDTGPRGSIGEVGG